MINQDGRRGLKLRPLPILVQGRDKERITSFVSQWINSAEYSNRQVRSSGDLRGISIGQNPRTGLFSTANVSASFSALKAIPRFEIKVVNFDKLKINKATIKTE